MIDFVKTVFGVSVRRVCRAVPAPRSTYHYVSKRPPQDVLRKRIRELAETHVRYGYRRIHILLQREGWRVNIKRVRRLYNLEGLQMRLKPPRRRVMAKLRSDRSDATGPNQVWVMDWMFDETFDGKRLWVLTVIDTWNRVCPVMRVCRSATAMEVIDALEEACSRPGPSTPGRPMPGPRAAPTRSARSSRPGPRLSPGRPCAGPRAALPRCPLDRPPWHKGGPVVALPACPCAALWWPCLPAGPCGGPQIRHAGTPSARSRPTRAWLSRPQG